MLLDFYTITPRKGVKFSIRLPLIAIASLAKFLIHTHKIYPVTD